MADLQTEIFTKVLPKMQSLTNLNFDDDANAEATTQVETAQPVLSITERIWRFIAANPNCTAKDITAVVKDDKGVATRINQLRSRGFVVTNYAEFPHRHSVGKPYQSTTKEERTARMMEARAVWEKNMLERRDTKPKKKMGRPVGSTKTRAVEAAPVARPTRVVDLNNLSIVEARKLYDELKQIFGG
jgi:hypothetical protein